MITNRKSQRPGFTVEQAREVQATEFAKALKNYFKLTLVVGVNNHNNVMFTPGSCDSRYIQWVYNINCFKYFHLLDLV